LVYLRRYDEALVAAERGLSAAPLNLQLLQVRVLSYLGRGDLEGARRMVEKFPSGIDPSSRVAWMGTYWDLFWVLDDADQRLLLRLTPGPFEGRQTWATVLAQTYWLRGDKYRARVYADTARIEFERLAAATPNDGQTHAFIGLANAYLGRKAEAMAAGERAVALVPTEKDGFLGPYFLHLLARTYTRVGENDRAVGALEQLLSKPYSVSAAWLRIDPNFEPLRTHPGFQRLLQGKTGDVKREE
jgi:tetratricopeptide (TPR) repeat protein